MRSCYYCVRSSADNGCATISFHCCASTCYFVQKCSTDGLLLLCYTPRVPDIVATRRKRSRDDGMVLLNYTVVMDRAPGPNGSLALYLKPDPVFVGIVEDSLRYQVLSGGSINIAVSCGCP